MDGNTDHTENRQVIFPLLLGQNCHKLHTYPEIKNTLTYFKFETKLRLYRYTNFIIFIKHLLSWYSSRAKY